MPIRLTQSVCDGTPSVEREHKQPPPIRAVRHIPKSDPRGEAGQRGRLFGPGRIALVEDRFDASEPAQAFVLQVSGMTTSGSAQA